MVTLANLCWRALAEKLEHVVSKFAQWQIKKLRVTLAGRWSGSKGEIVSELASRMLALGNAATAKSLWAWDARSGGLAAYAAGRARFALFDIVDQKRIESLTMCAGGFEDSEHDDNDDRIINMWTNESCHTDPVYDEVA